MFSLCLLCNLGANDGFLAYEFSRCRWFSFLLIKRSKVGDSRRPCPTNRSRMTREAKDKKDKICRLPPLTVYLLRVVDVLNWPMRVQNVIWSWSRSSGRIRMTRRALGKIAENRILIAISPPKIAVQSPRRVRPVTRILCGRVLTRPKWTKLPKCIFYCLIRLFRKVAIHEKL